MTDVPFVWLSLKHFVSSSVSLHMAYQAPSMVTFEQNHCPHRRCQSNLLSMEASLDFPSGWVLWCLLWKQNETSLLCSWFPTIPVVWATSLHHHHCFCLFLMWGWQLNLPHHLQRIHHCYCLARSVHKSFWQCWSLLQHWCDFIVKLSLSHQVDDPRQKRARLPAASCNIHAESLLDAKKWCSLPLPHCKNTPQSWQ